MKHSVILVSELRAVFSFFSCVCFPQRSPLERAIEEQPSEVYVKQEIPFTLEEVGMFLADIRSSLIGQEDGYAPHGSLPPLKVAKMDDITSCLSVLRNFIASWSQDISKNTSGLRADLKRTRERLQVRLTFQFHQNIRTSGTHSNKKFKLLIVT